MNISEKRCPNCSENMGQKSYVIESEDVLFWVCPDSLCGWEEEAVGLSLNPEEEQGEV